MTNKNHTKSLLVGLSALSLLAISACSTESEASVSEDSAESPAAEEQSQAASAGAVYDFSAVADSSSSDELRIEVPEQLIEAADDYRELRLIESVTVSAAEGSASQCGIELAFEYSDGTEELLADDDLWSTDNVFVANGLFHGASLDSSAELYEEDVRLTAVGHPKVEDADYGVDTTTTHIGCATSPEDFEKTATVTFPSFSGEQDNGAYVFEPFATVDLNVMASGDIHVVNANVEGYQYSGDEHGWISNGQTVDSQGNLIDG